MALKDYFTVGTFFYVVGAIVAIAIIWYVISKFRGGGRSGEEEEEEKETEKLERDEKEAEKAQKDEKKQCILLDNWISDILTLLRNSGNDNLAEQLIGNRKRISNILRQELSEKMSATNALELFKELHGLINEFIAKLPTDNQQINGLVEQIKLHQQRYYQDLVKELEMDEDEKKRLRKLWKEVIDEEQGTGNAAA